jgi:hypothetical protein
VRSRRRGTRSAICSERRAKSFEHCIERIVAVFDALDRVVSGDHRAAAFRAQRPPQTNHWNVVAIARSCDLVSDADRRRRHLRDENVRFFDPRHVARENVRRVKRIAAVADVLRRNRSREHTMTVRFERVDDPAVLRDVAAAAADRAGEVDGRAHLRSLQFAAHVP